MKDMFTDCISDDLIYLRQFKSTCIDKKPINFLSQLCLSSLCRLLIVTSVTGIDHYLNYSEEIFPSSSEPYNDALVELISPPKENLFSSEDDFTKIINSKIDIFLKFTTSKALTITRDDIGAFLAIRMIRNALVHMSWENRQIKNIQKRSIECSARKKYIVEQSLPYDLMTFTETHWNLINHIEQTFMNFLYINSLIDQ